VTAARLDTSYPTEFTVTKTDPHDWLFNRVGKHWNNTWTFGSDCKASTNCEDVFLTGEIKTFKVSATLTWDAKYKDYVGSTAPVLGYCVSTAYPVHYHLTIYVKVTNAKAAGTAWSATGWNGIIVGQVQYTSAGSKYCPAHAFQSNLSGA
jgi:hypothetical protein